MAPVTKYLVPATLLGASGMGLWYFLYKKNINSSKYGTNLFKGILFHLRQQQKVVDALGSPIRFDQQSQIMGDINMIKGNANVVFPVQGSNGSGVVHFRGKRVNQGNQWQSTEFELRMGEGRVISL